MAKIPVILEAGRADGKLATSSTIFDENKGMFQSEINDIQDTLNSDNPNKPLSAKQGKVLKELLDAKVIEAGAVPIDSEPTEGNITHVVNSDSLAKEFNKCNTAIINTDRIANEAIVPSKLSTDIQSLINNLSKTATFAGIATPTTNPETPEGPIFYIAKGKGTYTNFGGIYVTEDEMVILHYDKEWSKETTGIALNEKVIELDSKCKILDTIDDISAAGSNNLIKSGGVAKSIFSNVNTLNKISVTSKKWEKFLEIPLVEGDTYEITNNSPGLYVYLKNHTFVEGTDSGVTLLRLISETVPKKFLYEATTTETAYITFSKSGANGNINVKRLIGTQSLTPNLLENNELHLDLTTYIMSLGMVKSILGHLNNTNKIISYGVARHLVLRVVAGDSLFIVPNSNTYCAIAFVKTYNIDVLPYDLDLATNGEFRDVPVIGETYTVPDDARYIVIRHTSNTGVNFLPSKFVINGCYDIAKTLWDNVSSVLSNIDTSIRNIGTIENNVEVITDNDYSGYKTQIVNKVSYLDGITKVVNGVSITCNNDGSFVFSGSGTASGGRTYSLTNTFELKAGNYIAEYNESGTVSHPILQDTSSNIIKSFSSPAISFSVDSDMTCFIGVGIKKDKSYDGSFTFKILKEEDININKTAYDAVARQDIKKIGVPQDYTQKDTLKVNNIISNVPGNQGMCVIDGYLCSCQVGKIYVKQEGDILVGTKMKELGVSIHNNDVDYCEYTDTLISASLSNDNLPMAIYLLTAAKSKLYSSTDLIANDWIKILIPQKLDSEYKMVSNCFGERCDIVYAIVIDKNGFDNTNKRLLKIKLGMTEGIYDGTYTILSNREWLTKLEIQGSKYCNGKLYVSTDSYVNTDNILHAGVTVIDVENLRTVEYVAYANEIETSQRIEGEGIALIGSTIYQIVSNHTLGNTTSIREYSIMNL